ncbi:AtzE family amidohydrolase [Mesorhizobium sp. M6A.T.Cr.TU.016.01.1.1]|uniref:AtzE family amidohydrolase n=1 Tax=Mesorhizobium sp. M6A.T.Cr.TU.016.01.1.1 TaxID=2493677 RepID=UPI000F75336B|nr:AtzE family amidohydrolase [Mesorhizobium sp. M6A.T.Cr.TU.016.01.1.1]AZO68075.1 AtzE family amidohydrolase [Mesorhizobium sp. M6A.T.Cr.TU.016.01.1.1]
MIDHQSAAAIAAAVRSGAANATDVAAAAIERLRADPYNAVSAICADRAMADAGEIDGKVARGQDPGPLAGVPFGVKNLFNVRGLVTIAGSKIHADNAPAEEDAAAVKGMVKAGAIIIGALHMDEYAFGFTNENGHYGPCLNPHDRTRVSGGSSGGSAAAVAGGLLPLSLGTDTNGSIRIPAALCGIYGLKPTVGRVSLDGGVLFAKTLDTAGPFANSMADLKAVYSVLAGSLDPEAEVAGGPLRVALADEYYQRGGDDIALQAAVAVARILTGGNAAQTISLPQPEASRASAFAITACEGAYYHHSRLRTRAMDIAPFARDRLMAGALFPSHWYLKAQKFRDWLRSHTLALMDKAEVDIIVAPATPCVAPRLDQETVDVAGRPALKRAVLGLYTQPLAPLGFPILTVPIRKAGEMPLGVQLMGRPGSEELLLRAGEIVEESTK